MARNGSGVYALPTGQPVVTGTTISSTTHNTLMSDIANALTKSVASDGQTAMSANLPMGGNKLTGLGAATVAGDALRYEQFTPFMQAALLGTVSQSAGVPTGSVIERGSNANGDYVRFADGTQICTTSLPSGASPRVWTFPAAFAVSPGVTCNPVHSAGVSSGVVMLARLLLVNTGSVSLDVKYTALTGGSWGDAGEIAPAIAVGRWF